MKYETLIIEKTEYSTLKQLLKGSGFTQDHIVGKSVQKLLAELEEALILKADEMPTDVVRFNSTLTVESEIGWLKSFTLVQPNHSDVKKDKISILTPMGAAVIGYAVGDQISWEFPAGIQRFTIKKVVQSRPLINVNSTE